MKKKVKGFDTSSQSSDSSDKLNASMDNVLSSGRSTPTRNMAEGPPQWFISFMNDFERRQEVRFSEVIDNCKQAHDALNMTIQNVKDDLDKVKKELKETEAKLDDLENRNRRNNIVIFNLPEGIEGANCLAYFQSMLRENCKIDAAIQRAHRSGKPGGDKLVLCTLVLLSFLKRKCVARPFRSCSSKRSLDLRSCLFQMTFPERFSS